MPVIISIATIVGLLAVGIVLFIVVKFLVAKKKRRRSTIIMKPSNITYNAYNG